MRFISLVTTAALALVLVLGLAGAAVAYDGTMGGDMSGIHEPGTGMTEPGTGMTDGSGMMDGAQHMFGDAAGTWYEEYAQHMAQHEFMLGYTNGDFGGTDDITRAQFAVVMARMMGITPDGTALFSDMEDHWAEGHIAAMAEAGIIHGRTDGTFGPGMTITRAQMAAMMGRALEHVGAGLDEAGLSELQEQLRAHLTDVQGHWAEGHIAHMYGLGITLGDADGHFRPDEHTNRAQASAMMWRLYEGELQ